MRVLDLDLDFFLNDVVTWPIADRPSSKSFIPWNEEEVVNFLENNCGLSKENKIPGSIVTTHDEVYNIWRDLIESEILEIPFDVVHIDAHADIGMGIDSSYATICTDIVKRPIPQKYDPPRDGYDRIHEGNYLAYALASQWISSLTYVRHPNTGNDLIPIYFKDKDVDSGIIRIPIYEDEEKSEVFFGETNDPIGFEPDVMFTSLLPDEFGDEGEFNFMFLANSPKYTPVESDLLVEVIQEYIEVL